MDIRILVEKNYEWLKQVVAHRRFVYFYPAADIDDLTHDIIVELLEDNVVDKGEWGSVIHRVLDRQSKRRKRNRETYRIPNELL